MIGTFTALGVSLGYALLPIPNIELITATCFIAGYLLGITEGVTVGILTETLYSLLNPHGMAAPPLFIAQVISMGFAGFIGGLLGMCKQKSGLIFYIKLGMSGLILTSIFAVLTTFGFVLLLGFTFEKLIASFIFGLKFYVIHILTNILFFLTLVPAILKTATKAGYIYNSSLRGTNQ